MTLSYQFTNAEGTTVRRTDDDGTLNDMAWSTDPVQPLHMDTVWARQWLDDDSPIPDACSPRVVAALDITKAKTTATILGA